MPGCLFPPAPHANMDARFDGSPFAGQEAIA